MIHDIINLRGDKMNLSRNSINGIVSSQINANMQKHMREYSKADIETYQEERKISPDELSFSTFFRKLLMFVYNTGGNHLFENHLKYYEDELINYLTEMNEEVISSEDFTKSITSNQQNTIKILSEGHTYASANSMFEFGCHINATISYIPSINNETSNIIRIEITEELEKLDRRKEILHGNIDILDNGQIITNSFFKDKFSAQYDETGKRYLTDENRHIQYTKEETEEASINDSIINKERLEFACHLLENLFEKAELTMKPNTRKQ